MIQIHTPVGEVVERLEAILLKYKSVLGVNQGKVLSYEDFLKRPLPPFDIPKTSAGKDPRLGGDMGETISSELDEICSYIEHDWVSNFNIMSAQTQLPWHTNSDQVGWRTYYTKGGGAFKYIDENGEQQVSQDAEDGWTCRTFKVTADNPLWHSVYAYHKRFAFGFGKYL